jgi:hypothetical protein
MIELIENVLLKQRHEERVQQIERESQACLVQSLQSPQTSRLRLWLNDWLLHLGHQLKTRCSVSSDATNVGDA